MTNLDGQVPYNEYKLRQEINQLTRINAELRVELMRVQGLLDALKKRVENSKVSNEMNYE